MILIVYPWFPHYREEVFRELSSRYEAQFLLGHEPPPTDTMHQGDRSAIPARSGRSIWVGRLLVWQTGVVGRLTSSRRARTVVILGSVNYPFYWLLALYARFVLRRRVLFWTIGWHAPDAGIKKHLRLMFYRIAHGLLLYGSHGKVYGERAGYPADRMHVIGNSVGNSDLPSVSRSAPSPVAFGAIIRLNAFKRLDLLIRAAALWPGGVDDRPVVRLIGDGPARDELIEVADSVGVRLEVSPASYDESDFERFYKDLTAAVIPEAAGLSVIQALRYGVPVISHGTQEFQMPEAEAIVDGVTGWHFERGSVADLSRTLQVAGRAVGERPEVIAQMCQDEVSNRWTPESTVDRISEALVKWEA